MSAPWRKSRWHLGEHWILPARGQECGSGWKSALEGKTTSMNTDSSLVRTQHTLFFRRRFNSELKMVLGELSSDEGWEEWVHNSTAR